MTVDQLKVQRKSKKNSFNAYTKRRNAVRDIVSKIDSKFDDDIRNVNNQISNCISELQQGLKGVSKVSVVSSNIDAIKEKNTGWDSKLSSCRENLNKEVSRCQGRINSLDYEIRQLENQIRAQGGTIYFWE